MTKPAWIIAEWSREQARGAVSCAAHGRIEFDAAVAAVDDFRIGEPVHLRLSRDAGSFRVLEIWPDDPRIKCSSSLPSVAPLDWKTEGRVASLLASLTISMDYRLTPFDDVLCIRGSDDAFENGWDTELRLDGVEYLELPTFWSGKAFRLANSEERAYLATRCEVRIDSVAIKIVDDDLHPYFVVCRNIEVSNPTARTRQP